EIHFIASAPTVWRSLRRLIAHGRVCRVSERGGYLPGPCTAAAWSPGDAAWVRHVRSKRFNAPVPETRQLALRMPIEVVQPGPKRSRKRQKQKRKQTPPPAQLPLFDAA